MTDDWQEATLPVEAALVSTARTRTGAVAVGEGGVVLERTPTDWTTLVPAGPTAASNDLTDVDTTDDGRHAWFVGGSGAIGCLDLDTGLKYDHTAPMQMTSTWEAVAATGVAGGESLLLANGSGEVLAATVDSGGCPAWGDPVKPGRGSTISALALGSWGGVACDTTGHVYAVDDTGWHRIGVRNAEVDFFDVVADDRCIWVAGDDGHCYRYDRVCANWTPVVIGEETLRSVAIDDDARVVVGDSGTLARWVPGEGWWQVDGVSDADLRSIALGPVDLAVGDTVLERGTTRHGASQ